jgi:sensor histidine kinase YesM
MVCFVYAVVISTTALGVWPWVARWKVPHGPAAQGLLVAAALLTIALVGSVAASGVILAVGLWPAERAAALLARGVGAAVLVSVPLYVYDTVRDRRLRAERAWREEAQLRERAERLTLEARLASLESRVAPHFLVNALGTIATVVAADPARVGLMEQYAHLLSAALQRSQRRTVSLREELGVVWDYLEIEQAQLGHRLRWRLEVLHELWACEVPPFSLQGLVQNAIKHVAAVRPEGAEVRIGGELIDGQLALSVWDDGPGFARAAARAGHGLDTLRAQLAALYGDQARLEVEREGIGTRVTMWLPTAPHGRPR